MKRVFILSLTHRQFFVFQKDHNQYQHLLLLNQLFHLQSMHQILVKFDYYPIFSYDVQLIYQQQPNNDKRHLE
jgi:hypothetical protein